MSVTLKQKESMIRKFLHTILCTSLMAGFVFIFPDAFPKLNLDDSLLSNLPDFSSKNGLMKMPTPEEIDEIERFLATLSDSEIEELVKYGEKVMQIAEENNIPLFDPTPDNAIPASNSPTLKPTPATDTSSSFKPPLVKETVEEKQFNKQDVDFYMRIIEELLSAIQKIRQRISGVKKFKYVMNSYDERLDILTHYLHILKKETIIKHLIEKKYEAFTQLVQQYAKELNTLYTQLHSTLPSIEELYAASSSSKSNKTFTQQINKSKNIISNIEKSFTTMLEKENIISKIETILKEYEPSALMIKKSYDEKEKAAFESLKKITVTNVPKPTATPSPFMPPFQAPKPVTPPASKITPPTPPSSKTTASSASKPKIMEPVKKDKDKAKQKKTTLGEIEQTIIQTLDSIEQGITAHSGYINNFLTTYDKSKNEPDIITSALNEANFGLKKVKGYVDEWYKKIEKEATSKIDMEQKAKTLRDLFKNNNRHGNIKNVHRKIKSLQTSNPKDPKMLLEGSSVKRFKEFMDGIEKRIIDIF